MKKRILFFILLSLLCGTPCFAIDTWSTAAKITVGWDPVPGASYVVYTQPYPTGAISSGVNVTATQASITFTPGQWIVGVSSKDSQGESAIVWSDNPSFVLNGKTFGVDYAASVIIPAVPSGTPVLVSSNPVPSTSLLTNGDFEGGFTDGIGNGWSLDVDGGTGYSYSNDVGRSGGQSQKIVVTAIKSWGIQLYQKPAMALGKQYTVSGWYKSQGDPLSVLVCQDDHSVVVLEKQLPSSAAWSFFTFDFVWGNASADIFRIEPGVGSYWLDDVLLSP